MGELFLTHMKLEVKEKEDLNPSPTLEVGHLHVLSATPITKKHDKIIPLITKFRYKHLYCF